MNGFFRRFDRGQSLVLIALMMLALIGMLVLVLDGGNAYFQRRIAQTAADAGALAGARELCLNNGYTAAFDRAVEYACTRNGSDLPDTIIDVDVTNKVVSVTSSITFNNFFAQIFGHPETTVRAFASAGCYQPCFARSVLPIVWSCQPPVGGWDSDSVDCQQVRISFEQLEIYLAQSPPQVNPELYVVMDSLTYEQDVMCEQDPNFDPAEFTGIDCDFDGDGEMDFLASGGRSWVDLDGADPADDCPGASGEGSSELDYWITNGYGCDLYRHSWIAQQTGVTTSVFAAAWQRWKTGNPLVVVPVFDDMCADGHPSTFCSSRVHGQDTFLPVSGNQSYFHIIDYALFYITCVERGPADPPCPGNARFGELNGPYNPVTGEGNDVYNNGELNSMRSIEGYFLEGVPPDAEGKCTGGVDTGLYTLYLDD